ncbi:GntR family transcriptional regulator [Rhizobium sp. TH2]|uniref:GntR family transcriptional regulator n=1 Tax=Rhizobium sp. TH2 TaxID=2775403 RepID=UPI00220E6FC3|nr:GntR family transcriptional regulator [Rhizobium sp. TH2]
MSDLAYERVLEALFERKVQAGSFVSQGELSEIVEVPVAPLRDALRVLEAEGILTIHPRSGIQFVRPGFELTRATYQFRLILERAAVRIFAEEGDEDLIVEMGRRHKDLIETIASNGLTSADLLEMEELERLLHNAVIGILRNPLIESSYRRMHNYLRLLRLDRKLTAPIVLRTLKEHVEIVEACRKRDADRAEAALDAHFQAAMQRSLGLI